MRSSNFHCALFFCLLVVGNVGFAQIQREIQEKLIDRADEYAFELVQRRAGLPPKWAALQERAENHLTKIDELKVGVVSISEFTASSRDRKIAIHHVGQNSRIDDALSTEPPIDWNSDPFGNKDYWIFRQPGLILFKSRQAKWQIVPTVDKTEYPTADPFGWALATHGIASQGSLDADFLDRFFGRTRVCVSSNEIREGLMTYWGSPDQRKLASGTKVLFDKTTHLPVRVVWDFYDKGWDPKNFASFSHKTTSKMKIDWQEFKNNDAKIFLPVKIDLIQTAVGDRPHHVELTNRIRWLLNDEVPDSLFDDPSKREVVLPTFPEYPKK